MMAQAKGAPRSFFPRTSLHLVPFTCALSQLLVTEGSRQALLWCVRCGRFTPHPYRKP